MKTVAIVIVLIALCAGMVYAFGSASGTMSVNTHYTAPVTFQGEAVTWQGDSVTW